MAAKVRTGSRPGKVRRDDEPLERNIGCAVNAAIKLGFVVGREVLSVAPDAPRHIIPTAGACRLCCVERIDGR